MRNYALRSSTFASDTRSYACTGMVELAASFFAGAYHMKGNIEVEKKTAHKDLTSLVINKLYSHHQRLTQ